MVSYCLGWDVGAWNCDSGDSRDALVALSAREAGGPLEPVGRPWRGNLREVLDTKAGFDIIVAMLGLCHLIPQPQFEVTVAIDTPLGWPSPMLGLVREGRPAAVPRKADENPYLFRQTELLLFGDGHRPLSTVRDMIGSQSTKGIHFLAKADFARRSTGVWEADHGGARAVAIEAYPAPCTKSPSMCEMFATLRQGQSLVQNWVKGTNAAADVEDALRCAVVASWFRHRLGELVRPPECIPDQEGWIWLPQDCLKRLSGPGDEPGSVLLEPQNESRS